MSVVLAIERDPAQAEILREVLRGRVGADLVVVTSKAAAIAAIERQGVPDLILVTALLTPRDEEALNAHLRGLESAAHLQTLTIPQLRRLDEKPEKKSRFAFGGKKKSAGSSGADPAVFADEVANYLARARQARKEAQLNAPPPSPILHDSVELEKRPTVPAFVAEPPPPEKAVEDSWNPYKAPVAAAPAAPSPSDPVASEIDKLIERLGVQPENAELTVEVPFNDPAPGATVDALLKAPALPDPPKQSIFGEEDDSEITLDGALDVVQAEAEKEKQRIAAETEARLSAENEKKLTAEVARVRQETEARRLEELARLQEKAEAERKRAIEEARAAAEAEARERLAAEQARAAEAERARQEAEERRLAEIARLQQEAEEAKKRAEAEAAKQRAAEEARRKAEEARREAEAAKQREIEEARRKAEEEARRKAEEARREAEAAKQREIEEARRQAEEARRQAEEARRKAEEEKKREIEEARRAAEAAKAAAEKEARERKAAEQALAAELERVRKEAETRRAAELAALQEEAEAMRKRAIEEARAAAEAEAREALAAELARVRAEAESQVGAHGQSEQSFSEELAALRADAERALAAELERSRAAEEAARQAERARALEGEVARVRAESDARLKAELDRVRAEAEHARMTDKAELDRIRRDADERLNAEMAALRADAERRRSAELDNIRAQVTAVREAAAQQARAAAAEAVAAERARSHGGGGGQGPIKISKMTPSFEPGVAEAEPVPQSGEEPNNYYNLWREEKPAAPRHAAQPAKKQKRGLPISINRRVALPIAASLMLIVGGVAFAGKVKGMANRLVSSTLPAKETKKEDPAAAIAPPVRKDLGDLYVQTTPSGAKVTVDAKLRGESPLNIADLKPGKHKVVIETAEGTVRREVTIKGGERAVLDEAIMAGWLAVFSRIPLDVSINGKRVGSTDDGQILLAPGRHNVTLTNAQYDFRSTVTVEIDSGKVESYNVKLPTGRVSVDVPEGAEVWIEGERIGEGPQHEVAVPIGTREIVVKHSSFGERREFVEVRRGASVSVTPRGNTVPGGGTPRLLPLSRPKVKIG